MYVLRKTGWNTLDALKRITLQWNLPSQSISHAGLKDRHAVTSQLITIRNGPQRSFHDEHIDFEYLGQSQRATCATDIAANRFTIVLRSLSQDEKTAAEHAIPDIASLGIANYFDDQRFGSYLSGQKFIAEHWILGEYERALWLTFAEHHPDDSSSEREQKELLRQHWGDWSTCKQVLQRSHRRSIITFLDDRKDDFKGAWGRVNSEMRGLYLSAFQSFLWNRILNNYFEQECTRDQLIKFELKTGTVCVPTNLRHDQHHSLLTTELPLPSARLKLREGPLLEMIQHSLKESGWSLEALKIRYPRDRYFSKSSRPAIVPVSDLETSFAQDDLSVQQTKLTASFSLPRGCYATMVVKRLMLGANQQPQTPS